MLAHHLPHFAGMAVLVTGAAGFIGRHLCATLVAAGAKVHAVSRRPEQSLPDVEATHHLDLGDADAVQTLVEETRPDYVFHLASRVSGSRSIDEVMPTFASNLASTVHLLRAITNTRCRRLLLAGSLEETRDDAPSSPYAAAKSAATAYARMFHDLYGTPITILRLFMVYGPGQHDARKLVPYVALSLLEGRSPKLSSGVRPVDWVYIDDVVQGMMQAALDPDLNGQTIDIGTGHLTTVRSVAEEIGKLVGAQKGPVFGAIDDRTAEQVRAADPSRVRTILGRELTDLSTGLERTVAWYRERVEQGDLHAPAE